MRNKIIFFLVLSIAVFNFADAAPKMAGAIYSFKGNIKISKDGNSITAEKYKALEAGTVIEIGSNSELFLVVFDGYKYNIQKKALLKLTLKGIEGLNPETIELIKNAKKSVTSSDTVYLRKIDKGGKEVVSDEVQKELKEVEETTQDKAMVYLLKSIIYRSNNLPKHADDEYQKYKKLMKIK